MRAMLPLLFGLLFFYADVFAEEKPAVTEAEVQAAEAQLKLLKSDDYEVRESAGPELERIFKPATRDRVDFWDGWLQDKINAAQDDLDLTHRLGKLSPTDSIELVDKDGLISKWRIPFYVNAEGKHILHGAVFGYVFDHLRSIHVFKHGVLEGVSRNCESRDLFEELTSTNTTQTTSFRNGAMEGPIIKYHSNGATSFKGQYKNNLPNGEFLGFNLAGDEIGRFKMEMGTGTFKEWDELGRVTLDVELRDGHPAGHREISKDGKCIELSHHKYQADTNTSVPDGRWEAWTLEGKKLAQTMDLEYKEGRPMDGRVWIRLEELQKRWLYFKSGQLYWDPNDPGSAIGDFNGLLVVFTDTPSYCHVEIKDSRIVSGLFMGVKFKEGRAVGQKLPDENSYLNQRYQDMLDEHFKPAEGKR